MESASEQAQSRPGLATRFRPGQSGNPGGRAKGPSLRTLLLDGLAEAQADGKTKGQAIVDKLVALALEGNLQAIREIFDRIDGKALQTVENVEPPKPTRADVKAAMRSRFARMTPSVTRDPGEPA